MDQGCPSTMQVDALLPHRRHRCREWVHLLAHILISNNQDSIRDDESSFLVGRNLQSAWADRYINDMGPAIAILSNVVADPYQVPRNLGGSRYIIFENVPKIL
jgi:hypothetical protein